MTGLPQRYLITLVTALLCVASISVSDANQTEKSESVSASPQEGLEDTGDDPASNDSESAAVKKSQEDLEQLEDELQLESANRGTVLLDASDRVMEISRAPLTYIQENVPFLTNRNIIFFGRLELDGAHYSSGVLEDDSGFSVRRFRLGLAGRVKIWPGWNYKLEFDLTDGENSLSDAYLSWRSERWGTFRIGNQKVAQTLSGQTSSLTGTFMERPLPVLAFTLQRRLGLGCARLFQSSKEPGACISCWRINDAIVFRWRRPVPRPA